MIQERQPLAPLTTLGVGGEARFFARCTSEHELREAFHFAKTQGLAIAILGGGSNTLVPDEGFAGLVIQVALEGISFVNEGEGVLVTAGTGVSWDEVVRRAVDRSLWGIENLAGIPGTVGGAVVQNIGAYGAELAQNFEWAEVLTLSNGAGERVLAQDAHFAYRTSIFKQERDRVITRVCLRLSRAQAPLLSYPDLQKAKEEGASLATPREVSDAVRRIRSKKFPAAGTAGSFFKNPIVTQKSARALEAKYPGVRFAAVDELHAKIHLAWILDQVLHLKGYRKGAVRLFEAQPLVLVAEKGATAAEVEALANEVAKRTEEATGMKIVREVETLSAV